MGNAKGGGWTKTNAMCDGSVLEREMWCHAATMQPCTNMPCSSQQGTAMLTMHQLGTPCTTSPCTSRSGHAVRFLTPAKTDSCHATIIRATVGATVHLHGTSPNAGRQQKQLHARSCSSHDQLHYSVA